MKRGDKERMFWEVFKTSVWLAGVLFLVIVLTSCGPKPYHYDEHCREVNRLPEWKFKECTRKEWWGDVPQKKGNIS